MKSLVLWPHVLPGIQPTACNKWCPTLCTCSQQSTGLHPVDKTPHLVEPKIRNILSWYHFWVAAVLNRETEPVRGKGRTYIFICVHLQKVIFHIAQMLPDKCPGNSQYFHCGWHICHRWGGGQSGAQMGTPPSHWRWRMSCRYQTSTCDW